MKISRYEFELQFDALINAARSASSKETARRYLIQAENKIDGYSNIPNELVQFYREKITAVKRELGI
jgi:hypothetical protein